MSKVNRRSFIGSATVASGVAATTTVGAKAATILSESRGVSPNDKIHVGLIGCGGMGRYNLIDFLRVEEVECLALADVDTEQSQETAETVVERRQRRPDTYQDFRRLLDRDDIDVVIVATPDHWHALPTIMACQSGKDVYCEKPLATSIEEGRAMVNAARKYDRVVQIGTQQRSSSHFGKRWSSCARVNSAPSGPFVPGPTWTGKEPWGIRLTPVLPIPLTTISGWDPPPGDPSTRPDSTGTSAGSGTTRAVS